LTRQLIASIAAAIAIVTGLAVVAYFLTPAIERDAVLIGVVEYTDSAVLTTDAAARMTWLNAGFRRMTGLNAQSALGRTPEHLLSREITDPEACTRIRRAGVGERGFRSGGTHRIRGGRGYSSRGGKTR
jgi:PAS domain-containing protein